MQIRLSKHERWVIESREIGDKSESHPLTNYQRRKECSSAGIARFYRKKPLLSNWPDRRVAVGTEAGNWIEACPQVSEVTVLVVRMIVEGNVRFGELESRWCSI